MLKPTLLLWPSKTELYLSGYRFRLLNDLGRIYEETHAFDQGIVQKLGKPYELSKLRLAILNLVDKVGLSKEGWHNMLKKNNVFDKRLDGLFYDYAMSVSTKGSCCKTN